VLAVVGERRDDPNHLLLLGEDGRYYDLRLLDGAAAPIEPDEGWLLDNAEIAAHELADDTSLAPDHAVPA
jgi:hypothetical protein